MTTVLALAILAAFPAPGGPADLVIRDAKIYSAAPAYPVGQALAVRGGRIVAFGRTEDVLPDVGPKTRILELRGKVVLPGLIDSHGHMLNLGNRLSDQKLLGVKELESVGSSQLAVSSQQSAEPDDKFHAGDTIDFDVKGQGKLF